MQNGDTCQAAVHGAASDSVQVLPFRFPVSFLLREFLRQGEIPSHRSKQNKTFRGSANWVQQFFISAPQSLLPPHFSQALHSSAQVFFCVSVVLCSALLINLFVSSGSAGSFPFIPSPFGCGQASTENVGNTCAFCDLLAGLVYP